MCRKVVVYIKQIKSNAEGSSHLRIPACAIRIMEFTLSKDAKPFSSFPHNKFLFCSHNIGYVVKTYPSIDPIVAPPILITFYVSLFIDPRE